MADLRELQLVPVKTRILTQKDDIVDSIDRYARQLVGPDDIVCVAESVVAITQGRFKRPEDMHPGLWARVLCRFLPREASLSSAYGMQAAMDEGGTVRVVLAFIAGAATKLVGKSGVFYTLAGPQASLIDDVTGTMPPFDKVMVYGPKDPDKVAEAIKSRMGCYGAAVADVNDLKRAAVLGTSAGLDPDELCRILIDNPFGNDNQQTPIVIIKNYRAAVRG